MHHSLAKREEQACRRFLDLQGQCELNYLMLQQIFPDMRLGQSARLVVGRSETTAQTGDTPRAPFLTIEVVERAPYTTQLKVTGCLGSQPVVGELLAEVHMYHDARMAEVTHSSNRRLINMRNRYPNTLMLQPDEKWQANQFLGEWLDFFLTRGRRADDFARPVVS